MGIWSPHASGISIIIECSSERPEASRVSKALSSVAVSLCSGVTIGVSLLTSSPSRSDRRFFSRAVIQLMFPCRVLISPLWIMNLYGCASLHAPSVLVENREWTSANDVTIRSLPRSW